MNHTKTTRAFRTISEAGEELGLQPHVLRFWESKFSDIKPIKRGGGRRFYRPDDIEFIRGIKKLLHDEKHPIKDVQKLIKKKGPNRIVELGRSLEKAAREKDVAETDLLPKRIKSAEKRIKAVKRKVIAPAPVEAAKVEPQINVASPMVQSAPVQQIAPAAQVVPEPQQPPVAVVAPPPAPRQTSAEDIDALQEALNALEAVKLKMTSFRKSCASN